jgi:hypothetical protein
MEEEEGWRRRNKFFFFFRFFDFSCFLHPFSVFPLLLLFKKI